MKIHLKTETVGPRHDPYGRDTVSVTVDDRRAEWMRCALAGDTVRLYEGGKLVQALHVYEGDSKQVMLKARLLFKRHVGVFADAAENRYHEDADRAYQSLVEDMGPEAAQRLHDFENCDHS